MTEKLVIGRAIKLREGLEKLRIDIIKADSLGKEIRLRETIAKYNLPIMSPTYLVNIGAMEDITPPGPRKAEKRVKWIWTKSGENGPVDSKLVDAFIQADRKYNKEYRDAKRSGSVEVATILEKQLHRLPTKRDDGLPSIEIWLRDKLDKNTQVPGYLRNDESVVYEKMISIIDGLRALKEVMNKIHL